MARALITGSTSGLGLEFAWQLAGTGHDLVLVGRDEERLGNVSRQIRHVHDVDIEVMEADLCDRRRLDRAAVRLTDPVDPISLLVNNGGYALRGSFLEVDVADHEHQLDTLMRSVLVLSHAAAGAMVQRRRGAILNVSSLAGFSGTGPHAAARSWITVFTESLAAELEGTGVTATALLPGFVPTSRRARAAMTGDGLPRVSWLAAPFVVEKALRDAANGTVLSMPSVAPASDGDDEIAGPRVARTGVPGLDRLRRRLAERRVGLARRRASRRRLKAPWMDPDGR